MMHDPISQLGLTGVPVVTAIDEHGVVRLTHPDPKPFEREFVDRQFPLPAAAPLPAAGTSSGKPDLPALRTRAEREGDAKAWRGDGRAAPLGGGPARAAGARGPFSHAIRACPPDGARPLPAGGRFAHP